MLTCSSNTNSSNTIITLSYAKWSINYILYIWLPISDDGHMLFTQGNLNWDCQTQSCSVAVGIWIQIHLNSKAYTFYHFYLILKCSLILEFSESEFRKVWSATLLTTDSPGCIVGEIKIFRDKSILLTDSF